jgi:hypothetical protein
MLSSKAKRRSHQKRKRLVRKADPAVSFLTFMITLKSKLSIRCANCGDTYGSAGLQETNTTLLPQPETVSQFARRDRTDVLAAAARDPRLASARDQGRAGVLLGARGQGSARAPGNDRPYLIELRTYGTILRRFFIF